jgi:hypothetical protein
LFRKYFVVLILFGTCLLLAGCNPSKDEVVQNLLPTKEWKYALHVFYYQEDVMKIGDELNRFQNSLPDVQKGGFQVQLWEYNQERNKQWADALGVKKFPTYLIFNKDGVVLQTQDIEKAKKYLTEH